MRRQAHGTLRPLFIASFLLLILLVPALRAPSVSAVNQPPDATAGKDMTVAVGELAHFNGTGVDADGFLVKYQWDFYGNGIFEYNSTSTGETTWTYQVVGVYHPVFRITDNDGGTDDASIRVAVVTGNEPPTADAGPNRQVHALDVVTLVGTGKDPDGHIVKYEWDFDGNGKYDWSSTKNGTAQWMYTTTGTIYPVFRVTDDGGIPANATSSIKVVVFPADKPPVAKAGTDQTVHAGQTFRVSGTGYDIDGKIVRYAWDFNADGVADRESPTTGEALWSYDRPGTYTATLMVTDNAELPVTASDSIKITVLAPNKSPKAAALPAVKVYVGQLLFFNGTGTDEDGRIVLYEWDFFGNGTIEWSSSFNGSTFWVYNKPGTFNARFTVIDDVGAKANATREVTVQTKKPTPAPPLIQFNLTFVVALLIGIGVGIGAGVGATYGYLHASIAKKYKKVKELEIAQHAEEEASFRGTQVGEREPPTLRGGDQL